MDLNMGIIIKTRQTACSSTSHNTSAHTLIASLIVHGGSDSKEFTCNAEDPGSIPESGIFPGGGNGNPLQYSCLKNIGYRLYTGYRLPPYSSWGF